MLLVIKLGGEMIDSPELPSLAADVRSLGEAGHRVVIVHGGGPQTTELSTRLGLAPRIVAGRRVTDAVTLDVVKMVVAGRLNVDLCAALRAQGVRPLGLHGAVQAAKRPPRVIAGAGVEPVDLGLVGDVVGLDREVLEWAAGSRRVPVLACLGVADGAVYNINADVVANRIAVELGADMVMLVTGTDGVRRDAADPSSRIPSLTMAEGRRAIAEGVVWGGMIPKLEESFAALGSGVRSVLIVGRDLARAVAEPGSVGTLLLP
jgi:acetylglutamate kinase